MDNNEKRINVVKKIITNYFFNNDIKSSCLAQSYILYKAINNSHLVKGYIINHKLKIYYGHFWVEYNDIVYDLATETYLLYHESSIRDEIKNTRILVKIIPREFLQKYKNVDHPLFEKIRNDSYSMCLRDKMLEDMKEKVDPKIFIKIKYIYDKIVKI